MYPKKEHVWKEDREFIYFSCFNIHLHQIQFSFLGLPFLTNYTMVSTAECILLLEMQAELVLATLFVGIIYTRLFSAWLSMSVD